MQDGMTSERMSAGQIDVGSVIASVVLSGASLVVASGQIDATELAADSVTASEIAADAVGTSEQGFVGTGSPPSFDSRVLHGSGALGTATSAWVVFGLPFGCAPDVTIGGNAAITISDVNAGSFLVSGANTNVYYFAAFGSA